MFTTLAADTRAGMGGDMKICWVRVSIAMECWKPLCFSVYFLTEDVLLGLIYCLI